MGGLNGFGQLLKQWRQRRGQSQLELGLCANLSQKHISFLETGRARPKSATVEKVAEALDIPLRDRNRMFELAGLAPIYPTTSISDAEQSAFRMAMDLMLQNHDPYPAYVVDRYWNLIEANQAAQLMMGAGQSQMTNTIDYFFSPGPVREMIVNYADVAWSMLRRLQSEAQQSPDDEKYQELIQRATDYLQDVPEPKTMAQYEVTMYPQLNIGGQIINTVTMIAQFSIPTSVVLEDLRLELLFPADELAKSFFEQLAQQVQVQS